MNLFRMKSEEFIYITGIAVFICFLGTSDCKHKPNRICEDRRKLPSGACSLENDAVSANLSFLPTTSASKAIPRPPSFLSTSTVKPLVLPEAGNFSHVATKLAYTTLSSTPPTNRTIVSQNTTRNPNTINEGNQNFQKFSIYEKNINNALVQKENLHHPSPEDEESEEFVCTFADELHYLGTSPICPMPQLTVEDTSNDLESEGRQKRSIVGQRTPLTPEEKDQLQKLYGKRFNLESAERLKSMGESIELKNIRRNHNFASGSSYYPSRLQQNQGQQRPYNYYPRKGYPRNKFNNHVRQRRQELRKKLLVQFNPHDESEEPMPNKTELIKLLLEELTKEEEEEKAKPSTTEEDNECSLYGTWLSPLAGVAIELQPVQGTVRVSLEDLPYAKQRLITSSWAGSVMISPVTPTTMTLLLQETSLQPGQDSPGTAVFTGQCVSCKGGAAIQGTWVIFSRHPECSQTVDYRDVSSFTNTSVGLYE